jgi:hypothetical protein
VKGFRMAADFEYSKIVDVKFDNIDISYGLGEGEDQDPMICGEVRFRVMYKSNHNDKIKALGESSKDIMKVLLAGIEDYMSERTES